MTQVAPQRGLQARKARIRVGALDQPCGNEGAGIDHGVETALRGPLGLHDGVETVTGRFHADVVRERVGAVVLQRQAKHEGFGDRLDGERPVTVTARMNGTVDGHGANAEQARIGARQLGQAGCDLPPAVIFIALMQLCQESSGERRRRCFRDGTRRRAFD